MTRTQELRAVMNNAQGLVNVCGMAVLIAERNDRDARQAKRDLAEAVEARDAARRVWLDALNAYLSRPQSSGKLDGMRAR